MDFATWAQLEPRQRDALVAEHVIGLRPIEWRLCYREPECGEWEDAEAAQTLHENIARHPCYNWLDTDEPKRAGWTDADIAETDRAHYWKVVPSYTLDYFEMRTILDAIEQRGLVERYQNALIDVLGLDMAVYNSAIELISFKNPSIPNNTFEGSGHAALWRFARATHDQICLAAVRACEVP